MEILSKISTKTLGLNVKQEADGELYKIVGNAKAIECGESSHGEWEALVGEFMATKADGSEFTSGKAFLPNVALNLLKGNLLDGKEIQFAFSIGRRSDESSPVGYVYTVKPMIEAKENPLKALMEEGTKALGEG